MIKNIFRYKLKYEEVKNNFMMTQKFEKKKLYEFIKNLTSWHRKIVFKVKGSI